MILCLLAWSTLLWRWTVAAEAEDYLLVQTNKGAVRGATILSAYGKKVDAFLGIPYAKPPVGAYRFRHPKPADPWDEVLDGTAMPNSCVQVNDTQFGDFKGSTMWNANGPLSEDCLTLSLWRPHRSGRAQLAVMVWVYGGAFYTGTTTLDVYDPRILSSEEEVVVVSVNYRLASLGFLFVEGGAEAPGNAGLFDQLMALEWVRDNAARFGGDPNNVTIFGESAGAASVAFHLVSSLSRPLFARAILQSGSANAPFALVARAENDRRARLLASAVECPSRGHPKEMVACLRERDPQRLVHAEWELQLSLGILEFPFVPVVDGALVDESPAQALRDKNFKPAPLLAGTNADEGNYFVVYELPDLFKKQEEGVYLSRQELEHSVRHLHPAASAPVVEAILFEYTDWTRPQDAARNRDAVDKMVGDRHFVCPLNEWMRRYAEAGNDVYAYFYAHRSSVNPWPRWMGVLHADEINFVFGEPLDPQHGYTQDEQRLSKRIMRYWANFARTGNPNQGPDGEYEEVYWPVFTTTGREYLTLAVNSSEIGHGLRAEQCAFWHDYLPKLEKHLASNPSCNNGFSKVRPRLLLLVGLLLVVLSFLMGST